MDIELIHSWQIALVAFFLVGEAVLSWKRPMLGAAAVVFLLPVYIFRIRLFPIPTNVLELFLLVFVGTVLVGLISQCRKLVTPPRALWIPLVLIVLGASLSAMRGIVLVDSDPELTRAIFGSLKGFILEPILFVFILVFLNYRGLTSIVGAYVGSAVVVAVLALVGGALSVHAVPYPENPWSFLTFDDRLRGLYLSPNHLAMYVLPAIFLLLGAAYSLWPIAYSKPRKRTIGYMLYAICFSALLGALLWTKSAGAVIALVAGLVAYGLWLTVLRRSSRPLFYILHSTFYILLVIGLLLPFAAVHFSKNIVQLNERSPLASRVVMWDVGTELLEEHWLFGIGPGAFQYHYLAAQEKHPPYLEWAVQQPHNLFLSLWLQTGILGLVAFVWLIAYSLWLMARDLQLYAIGYRLYAIATSAALVAILVFGFVDTPFWKNDLAILAFVLTLGAHRVK